MQYVEESTTLIDERAAYVQSVRAFADFIETHADLPVPDSICGQANIFGTLAEQRAVVEAAAAALGREPAKHVAAGSERLSLTYTDPAGFSYVVYANAGSASDAPPRKPAKSRPYAVFAPASAPTPLDESVGAESHPDGPAVPDLDEVPAPTCGSYTFRHADRFWCHQPRGHAGDHAGGDVRWCEGDEPVDA